MANLKNTSVSGTGYIRVPSGNTSQRPGSPQGGMIRYNTQLGYTEVYKGSAWEQFEVPPGLDGLTPQTAAPSAKYLVDNYPNFTNGTYFIKPLGSSRVVPIYCDLEGTEDVGAGWMRVQYRDDYYSRSSPWGQTANGNPAAFIPSQEFFFDVEDDDVLELVLASTDVRQRFETYGYGSVGWTYSGSSNQYQSHVGINGNWYHSSGVGTHLTNPRPTGISFQPGTSYTSFTNPSTARNTDPTDINDGVWRDGTFSFRDTSGTGILPIKRISNADVDSTAGTELRYFPLRNGDNGSGSADGDGSRIWIYIP